MTNPLTERFAKEMLAFNDVEVYIREILEIDWLWPEQMKIIKDFYDSERNYEEMIIVAGMRGGKTTVASIMATYEAFKLIMLRRPNKHYGLPRGNKIFILNVATSEQQAKDTVFAAIEARLENSSWWKDQDCVRHHNERIFAVDDGEVILRSEHSNSASLAGKTCICVIFDELARFKERGTGKSTAEMVYATLSRSVKTFGRRGKKISISSPIHKEDYIMYLYRSTKKNPRVYRRHLSTWEMNPTITREDLDDEFERDPETAWRDYGAIPSAAIETYFKEPERLKQCFVESHLNLIDEEGNLRDIEHRPETWYFLAGDPAFTNDSFGLAMVHRENESIIADLLHRFKPEARVGRREIDAKQVKNLIISLSERFDLYGVRFDTWQFPETVQAIEEQGIKVENHIVKKEDYDYLKELIYTGRIKGPIHEVFIEEVVSLELIRGTKIDHPRGGSKDVSDALASAVAYEREFHDEIETPLFLSV